MMRRIAKVEKEKVEEIKARELDPIEMTREWIEICDGAEKAMIHLADTRIDMPIGVAFVDAEGRLGWIGRDIGRDPSLSIHRISLRGCWPRIHRDG